MREFLYISLLKYISCIMIAFWECNYLYFANGLFNTRDESSVWKELIGQATIVRLIIRLCINADKQTDHPSRQVIWIIRFHTDSSSGRMIHLLACIYTQTNYGCLPN